MFNLILGRSRIVKVRRTWCLVVVRSSTSSASPTLPASWSSTLASAVRSSTPDPSLASALAPSPSATHAWRHNMYVTSWRMYMAWNAYFELGFAVDLFLESTLQVALLLSHLLNCSLQSVDSKRQQQNQYVIYKSKIRAGALMKEDEGVIRSLPFVVLSCDVRQPLSVSLLLLKSRYLQLGSVHLLFKLTATQTQQNTNTCTYIPRVHVSRF